MITRPVTIDASTLLNLLATGESATILRSIEVDKFVCSAAAGEVLYLRGVNPDDAPERVSVQPLIESGVIAATTLESADEEALFVEFAARLDDGEAMSLAICAARGHALATDDRKARRIAESLDVPAPVLATSEMIWRWAESESVGSAKVREVLTAVEMRARFRPWHGYPLRDWWIGVLSSE